MTRDAAGKTLNRYIELGTGLNYWNTDSAQWEPSVPRFEITPRGDCLAHQSRHHVRIAPNLNVGGAVTLRTPDGQTLISTPLALGIYEPATGRNALIAQIQDCVGEQVAPNVIEFVDAFDGVTAAIRYTLTAGGFEQDIVLLEDISDLAKACGLNPDAVELQILSEFYGAPTPGVQTRRIPDGRTDEILTFGQMDMAHGTAYLEGQEGKGIPMRKQWKRILDRQVLVESVPYNSLRPWLQTLPQARANSKAPVVAGLEEMVASVKQRELLSEGELLLAAIEPGEPRERYGVVLDYSTIDTSLTDFRFLASETYYVTATVYMYGNTVLEGNTVIKYPPDQVTDITPEVNPCTWYQYDITFRLPKLIQLS